MHPQAFGSLYLRRPCLEVTLMGEVAIPAHWEVIATCALGSALWAAGKIDDNDDPDNDDYVYDDEVFPALKLRADCPVAVCGWDCCSCRPLDELIPHLNDEHRWTREQIADFVERVEAGVPVAVPNDAALQMA
jgi:hypothetical protein